MAGTSQSIGTLLRSWKVAEQVIKKFVDEEVTLESLLLLKPEDFREWIPKAGPRQIFLAKLEEYKTTCLEETPPPPKRKRSSTVVLNDNANEEANEDLIENYIADKSSLATCNSINDLHAYLQQGVDGKLILAFYDNFHHLDDKTRDELAQKAIFYLIEKDLSRVLFRDDFLKIAKQLIELFPSECMETWYDIVTKKKRTFVEGRLRFKYYSVRRSLLKCGLLSKREVVDEEDSNDPGAHDNPDEENDDLIWLQNNHEPLIDVISKWEATYDLRKRVRARSQHISDYTTKFPALRREDGWQLLVKDGDRMHPEFSFAEFQWSRFVTVISQLIKRKHPSFVLEPGLSKDEKLMTVLENLSCLFKVRTIPKSSTAAKGSKNWRPSRQETQEGFCLVVTDISQIKEKLDLRRKRLELFKFKLQLIPVFVKSSDKKITQCFIVLDNFRWELKKHTPEETILATLKAIFALDAQYPPESRHLWLFVQRLVFDIETDQDFSDDKGLRSYMSSYFQEYRVLSEQCMD